MFFIPFDSLLNTFEWYIEAMLKIINNKVIAKNMQISNIRSFLTITFQKLGIIRDIYISFDSAISKQFNDTKNYAIFSF